LGGWLVGVANMLAHNPLKSRLFSLKKNSIIKNSDFCNIIIINKYIKPKSLLIIEPVLAILLSLYIALDLI